MKEYKVAYIKNGGDYAYDTYMPGTTVSEIIDELTYNMNRYGVDYDEIAIYDVNDEDDSFYYHVVNNDGKYQLEA
nr:MAG: hypothetical protein [Bacteriophage sp.]